MTNYRFTPANLAIVGDTVTWVAHLWKSRHSLRIGVPSGVWNSNTQYPRLMSPGQSYSVTFNSAGTPTTAPRICSWAW